MIYDVIIIGAGTAGMTAALNALRNGKTVLVLEKKPSAVRFRFRRASKTSPRLPQSRGRNSPTDCLNRLCTTARISSWKRSPDLKRTATSSPFLPTTARTKGNPSSSQPAQAQDISASPAKTNLSVTACLIARCATERFTRTKRSRSSATQTPLCNTRCF